MLVLMYSSVILDEKLPSEHIAGIVNRMSADGFVITISTNPGTGKFIFSINYFGLRL